MYPTTPTSPSFFPPSPPTPHSPSMMHSPLMVEPIAQPIMVFSQEGMPMPPEGPVPSPSLSIVTNTWSAQSLARRDSSTMSICSARESSTPHSPALPALYTMRSPDQACFQGSSSPLRDDGRKSRMSMRSPHFNRVMTLPLRVNTSMFPNFAPEPMAPISEHGAQSAGTPVFSNCETLVDWFPPIQSPAPPALPLITQRSQARSPARFSPSSTTRSPIRKHFRGKHLGGGQTLAQTPPRYHVTVSSCPSSPLAKQRFQQYLYGIEHLRAPLVPLISVTNGLPHPAFPSSLLQYHLLTHEQLDSLARWYHQVTPPIEETFMYPAWVPAWTGVNDSTTEAVDLETKRRRWGRFIGLRGCESPTATGGPDGENPDELVHRMEREWRRTLERADEEDRAWEKSWRGRW